MRSLLPRNLVFPPLCVALFCVSFCVTAAAPDVAYAVKISLHGHSVYSGVAHVSVGTMTTLDHRTPFPLRTSCRVGKDSPAQTTLTSGRAGQTVEIGATSIKHGLVATLVHLSSSRLVRKLKVTAGGCVGEAPVLATWDAGTSFDVGLSLPQSLRVGGYTVTVHLLKSTPAVRTSAPVRMADTITI